MIITKSSLRITGLLCILLITSCKKDETIQNISWLPQTETISGIEEIFSGIRTIKIWGDYYSMGYSYGYLLAEDIVGLLNSAISDESLGMSASIWDSLINQNLNKFTIPQNFIDEMNGILDGINSRTEQEGVFIEGLDRNLTLNDLKGLNCDLARISCSSFSAWGTMTSDGTTLTGRNMDYGRIPTFLNKQIIIIRIPENSEKKAWISINWPGDLGCTTGMNEDGLTVSQQDVYSNPPHVQNGYTPDNYIHRLIIENASAENVEESVTEILQNHYSALGCAPLISWPNTNNSYSAIVPEFDGKINTNNGFDIRYPEIENEYLIGTNHFRIRNEPMDDCWRYNLMETLMHNIKNGDLSKLTKEACIEILKTTPIPELICMHSVVFEPNKGLMHIALTDGINHASEGQFISFNVSELITIK